MTSNQTQPIIVQQKYQMSKQYKLQNISLNQMQVPFSQENRQKDEQKANLHQKNVQKEPTISENTFFQVMDLVEQYDQLIKQMNQLYTQGMLKIAEVKFANPYTSLSTKGFKPTPAITKIHAYPKSQLYHDQQKQQQPQRAITINKEEQAVNNNYLTNFKVVQQKDIRFVYSVIDQINGISHEQSNFQENENILYNESQQTSLQADSSLSTANQLYSYEDEQLMIEQEQVTEDCRKFFRKQNTTKQDFILQRFCISAQKPLVEQAMRNFNLLLQKLLEIAQVKIKVQTFTKKSTQ